MSKAVPIHNDEYVPKRRKFKPETQATKVTKQFRLRDPATGLFWGVSAAERPQFNTDGKKWSTAASALRNWADYDLQRGIKNDDAPKVLELVEYEVVTTRKGVANKTPPDMSKIVPIMTNRTTAARFGDFAKRLTLEGYKFQFLVECWGSGKELVLPDGFNGRTKARSNHSFTRREADMFLTLAVPTKADLAMIWLALGTNIEMVWDFDKGEVGYEREHPPLSTRGM